MINKWRKSIFSFLIVLLLFNLSPIIFGAEDLNQNQDQNQDQDQDQDQKQVYVVPIHGEIERGLYAFMNRAFQDARDEGVDLIVLDIDTPGGTLDAAFDIKDLIVNEETPVYAFVNYRAISAGSFLALASEQLYMRTGGQIGAAEAVLGEEPAGEKVMSVWESEMRSVAELHDRDPEIAAAMIRRNMEIEGLVREGELLTLSAREAVEYGMADGIADSYEELLAETGYEKANVQEYPMAWAEKLARFFTSPMVASLLLTLGMAGLIIEITSPGLGVPGLFGLLAFGLFFGGHLFAGLAGYEVLLFFGAGIIFLLLEAFIAGFGIFGLVGVASFGFSIVLSAADTQEGLVMLLYSMLGTIIVLTLAFKFFIRSRFWDRIILSHSETTDQGYVGGNTHNKTFMGQEGITETTLRPTGTAQISGERVDVISEGGYIPKDTKIIVSKVEGSRIIVQEAKNETSEEV